MDEKIISIIPARGGSKSIKDKNIIPIAGKPLLSWTIEQSLNTKSIDDTYVSTNNIQIAAIAEKWGAKVIWRPDELCTDQSSSEATILHALDYLEKEKRNCPQLVVFLQATSPLRRQNDIENALFFLKNKNADSLISGSYLNDFLIWEKNGDIWKSINYDFKNRGRRQNRTPQFVENGSIYIFKPEILKKYGNRIGGRLELYEMEFWQTWEIDTKEDVELIEFYLNRKLKPEFYPKIENIELIVFDFDGVFTDNKVLTLQDGTEGVLANRSDGLAIQYLKNKNIPMIIISTETNPVVKTRADKIGLTVIQGIEDKKQILANYCEKNSICLDNVIYIGNDINDKQAMEIVGWPMCPNDSHYEIRNISKIIFNKNGGEGVVNELYELLSHR